MILATAEVASERMEDVSMASKLTLVDRFRHGILHNWLGSLSSHTKTLEAHTDLIYNGLLLLPTNLHLGHLFEFGH